MKKLGCLLVFVLSVAGLSAQLSVTNDLHPDLLGLGAAAGAMKVPLVINPTNQQPVTGAQRPQPFDFSQTAPHLAFFCRLEINEKAGGVIPAKFRLGAHRYWQDNLLRR
ncbi:MAG: hypothetical protein AAFZ52_02670 [Bacteroidota bacterium]